MNLIYNYSGINLKKTNISSSLVFYLYYKNKIKYIKNFNSIRAFYFDPIVKGKIYIASNGLKKNIVFRREEFNDTVLCRDIETFVSVFYNIEDNLFKFFIYKVKYFKDLTINFLKKQQIINIIERRLNNNTHIKLSSKFLKNNHIEQKLPSIVVKPNATKIKSQSKFFKNPHTNINLQSKFWKNFIVISNSKKNIIFGNFDKIFLVRRMYLKISIITNKGFIKSILRPSSDKQLFARLSFFYKGYIKKTYKFIMILNYILLVFFCRTILSYRKNSRLLFNIIIYYNFWKFLRFKYEKYLKQRKIKLRKSNFSLVRINKLSYIPILKIMRLYYYLVLKRSLFQMTSQHWVKNLIFNNNDTILDTNTEIVQRFILYNKVNLLSLLEKINAFISIFNYIKYYIILAKLNETINTKLFFIYFYLKSTFVKTILKLSFSQLKWYFEKNLIFNLYDLLFLKLIWPLKNFNEFFSEKIIFSIRTFDWSIYLKKGNLKVKVYYKRLFNNLFLINSKKRLINKFWIKFKIKKSKIFNIKNFCKKFNKLSTDRIKKFKLRALKKIRKYYLKKHFNYSEALKRVLFINNVLLLLLLERRHNTYLPIYNQMKQFTNIKFKRVKKYPTIFRFKFNRPKYPVKLKSKYSLKFKSKYKIRFKLKFEKKYEKEHRAKYYHLRKSKIKLSTLESKIKIELRKKIESKLRAKYQIKYNLWQKRKKLIKIFKSTKS